MILTDCFIFLIETLYIIRKNSCIFQDGTCSFNKSEAVTTVTGFVSLTKYEDVLKQAVATIGPISAAVDGSHASFQSYNSG